MADFFDRLVQRSRGEIELVQPRIAPAFAPLSLQTELYDALDQSGQYLAPAVGAAKESKGQVPGPEQTGNPPSLHAWTFETRRADQAIAAPCLRSEKLVPGDTMPGSPEPSRSVAKFTASTPRHPDLLVLRPPPEVQTSPPAGGSPGSSGSAAKLAASTPRHPDQLVSRPPPEVQTFPPATGIAELTVHTGASRRGPGRERYCA